MSSSGELRLERKIGSLSAKLRPTASFFKIAPKYDKPEEEFLYHVEAIERLWAKLSPGQRKAVDGVASALRAMTRGVQ